MIHKIIKCRYCGKVLLQCRCPADHKDVEYSDCGCRDEITEHGGPIYDLARNAKPSKEELTVEPWIEHLQFEVMDDYISAARMFHKARDYATAMRSLRKHWGILVKFVRNIRSEAKQEGALEAIDEVRERISDEPWGIDAVRERQHAYDILDDMKRKISNNE